MPARLAAAGDPDVKGRRLKGYQAGKSTFKVHLDGDNFLPCLTGQAAKGPRESFITLAGDGVPPGPLSTC